MTVEPDPTVAGPANDETEIVTREAVVVPGLAWSQDDGGVPDASRGWGRVAVPLFAVSVAAFAAAVTGWLLLRPHHEQSVPAPVTPVTMTPPTSSPMVVPPSAAPSSIAEPSPSAATLVPPPPPPSVWTPPVPPPSPTRVSQEALDEEFLTEMTEQGMRITDVPAAIYGAHSLCDYLAAGHTGREAAALAMHNNGSLTQANAEMLVMSAVRVYCPEFAR